MGGCKSGLAKFIEGGMCKKLETNQNKGLSTSQVKKDWSNMVQMS
ncbi:MAG: hypothetical protein ACLSCV_08000 [Acutalibacteraceae bacterium]